MRAVVVEMGVEETRHPDDEQIEKYSLGILSEAEIPALEQHLLLCADCQDRVAEADLHVQAVRAQGRELRAAEKPHKTMCHSCGHED